MLVGKVTENAIASGELSAHVVHDAAELNATIHRGVRLHKLRGRLHYNPSDGRWAAYSEVLQELRSTGVLHPMSCIYAIDLGDVRVIGNLSALCANAPGRRTLFVGTDACTKESKKWLLNGQSAAANYTVLPRLRHWLHKERGISAFNCGILGGRLHTFERFHAAYVERISAHYQRAGTIGKGVVDMLVFNSLLAEHCQCGYRSSCNCTNSNLVDSLVRGYPFGPVNLPMCAPSFRLALFHSRSRICAPCMLITCRFGKLCHYHARHKHSSTGQFACGCETRELDCDRCIPETLNVMQSTTGGYYFTHHMGCGQRLPCL